MTYTIIARKAGQSDAETTPLAASYDNLDAAKSDALAMIAPLATVHNPENYAAIEVVSEDGGTHIQYLIV